MKIDFSAIFSRKENIVSTLLVLSVIIFIAFLFPSTGQFNLKYKQGEIWKYEDLLAPFEYAVLKNQDEVSVLKKQVRENFVPRFRRTQSPGIVNESVTNFIINLKDELKNADYQNLLRYLKENQNKLLISKEQT